MVLTGSGIPIIDQIKLFFIAIFGYIYLFFATILSDPKTLANDHQPKNKRWGSSGTGGNMHGLGRSGAAPRGGG
jgi:hypothetical protein